MPTYIHQCQYCPAHCEAEYSIKFVGDEEKLPSKVWDAVHCTKQTCCLRPGRQKDHLGELWPRVPQVPHLAGSSEGTMKSESQLLKEKQTQRKLRSRLHFKNDVLKTIKDPGERRHFEKKTKNLPKKDHEKM